MGLLQHRRVFARIAGCLEVFAEDHKRHPDDPFRTTYAATNGDWKEWGLWLPGLHVLVCYRRPAWGTLGDFTWECLTDYAALAEAKMARKASASPWNLWGIL